MQQTEEKKNNIFSQIFEKFRTLTLKAQFIITFLLTMIISIGFAILIIQLQINVLQTGASDKLATDNQTQFSSQKSISSFSISYQSDMYYLSQKINNLFQSYTFFTNNPNIYQSNQGFSSNNPKNTSDWNATSNYTSVAFYFIQNISYANIFYSHSFFDIILPFQINQNPYVKRINIIYINNSNFNQTAIRTFPATNNFQVNNIENIINIYNQSSNYKSITITNPYNDYFSNSNQMLMSLLTKITTTQSNLELVFQIQLQFKYMYSLFNNYIYFPNTTILYTFNNASGTIILANSTNLQSFNLATPIYSNIILDYNLTELISNNNNYDIDVITFSNQFQINNLYSFNQVTQTNYSFIQIDWLSQTKYTSDSLSSFLSNEQFLVSSSFMLTGCLAIMTIIAFSYIGASVVSYPLQKTERAIQKYFEGMELNTVTIKLKKCRAKDQVKNLVDNIQNLLQRLQQQKQKYESINYEQQIREYPQNDFDNSFLERMKYNFNEVWELPRKQLIKKHKKLK